MDFNILKGEDFVQFNISFFIFPLVLIQHLKHDFSKPIMLHVAGPVLGPEDGILSEQEVIPVLTELMPARRG